MSFITKRERVFNEYDLFDLPSRNEGKLKAYASCTDARAWSHFGSDQSEHLVEIIKRNNETCRPKYVPTDVIVNTLMVAKNTEIGRLKRKVEEFEQMLAAYDKLDLTCEQKCEIANAHDTIREANKELDEMFLDLDLSGFTESDAFETGNSRDDESARSRGSESVRSGGDLAVSSPRVSSSSKSVQAVPDSCPCDKSTSAHDPRIGDMQDQIINKDAKLNAMRNTIAVMENDVCEPYCVYAHIYTALEKIFAILSQNDKYKQYLDLLTTSKDLRDIDIQGKIIFKLKILEKFSLALIAPCATDRAKSNCSCFRTEVNKGSNDAVDADATGKGSMGSKGPIDASLEGAAASADGTRRAGDKTYPADPTRGKSAGDPTKGRTSFSADGPTVITSGAPGAVTPGDGSKRRAGEGASGAPDDDDDATIKSRFGKDSESPSRTALHDDDSKGGASKGNSYYDTSCTCCTRPAMTSCGYCACCSRSAHSMCDCYRSEITYALTPLEASQPMLDNKRAQLVADIMEHEEMKEILSKSSASIDKFNRDVDNDDVDDRRADDRLLFNTNYNIDEENLARLKTLQDDYEDLMKCYESLKHEKSLLIIKCQKYEDMEKELESLRVQMRDYAIVWKDKEHYRKRSEDLDSLREQFIVLSEETTGIENQLKAEAEINNFKSRTIEDLRRENIYLEQQLNEMKIACEKEKNTLQCKLKEAECRVLCQDQQIRTLSGQMDRLLDQDVDLNSPQTTPRSIALLDEIEALKQEIMSLKNELQFTQDEKQQLGKEYQDKLKVINGLRLQIEDWKSHYEGTVQRNDYLEKYAVNSREEFERLSNENRSMSQDFEDKNMALLTMLNNKTKELNNLYSEMERMRSENENLHQQLQNCKETHSSNIALLEKEKRSALESYQLAERKSQQLLEKVRSHEDIVRENEELRTGIASISQEISNQREAALVANTESKQKLHEKLKELNNLSEQLEYFKDAHNKLQAERSRLEDELKNKAADLENAIHAIECMKDERTGLLDKLKQTEKIKEDYEKLNGDYKKVFEERQRLQDALNDKNGEIDKMIQSLNEIQREHAQQMESKNVELNDLKKSYDELVNEKQSLQSDIDNIKQDFNNLYNNLEHKIEENKALSNQINLISSNKNAADQVLAVLKEENEAAKVKLDVLRQESSILLDKIVYYEKLEKDFDNLKRAHDAAEMEKNKLQMELEKQLAELKRENEELNTYSRNLSSQNDILEKAVISTRNELSRKSEIPDGALDTIRKEINDLKNEKLNNQKTIRTLRDQLDQSENIISDLKEMLLARDDKVSMLENQINALEHEIRMLHDNMSNAINAGEQIKELNYQNLDQSLKSLEAHHSRATHNIRADIVNLQNANKKLEEDVSVAKIHSEEMSRERNKCLSKVANLQNEREIIAADIKQLELRSTGDSALQPQRCSVEEVLRSLDRIGTALENRNTRSNSLEQTLLKVQTSSQVLVDEAKKIVEKEKHKILMEKEEAIRDKNYLEKQLIDLKTKLEEQASHDQEVIEDLQAEIMNQKLICDKIKNQNQNYIAELKEKLRSLQESYTMLTDKNSQLQEALQNSSKENLEHLDRIKKINADLTEKSNEIGKLQKDLDKMIKVKIHADSQTIAFEELAMITKSKTQEMEDKSVHVDSHELKPEDQLYDDVEYASAMNSNNISSSKDGYTSEERSGLLPRKTPATVNEVQILAANVEPTLDFIKSSYLQYKMKQLSCGKVECSSIPWEKSSENLDHESTPGVTEKSGNTYLRPFPAPPRVIDLYNRDSLQTDSSKVIDNDGELQPDPNIHERDSPHKSSAFTGFGLTNDSFETRSEAYYKPNETEKSGKNDLYVIYRDEGNMTEQAKQAERTNARGRKGPDSLNLTNVRKPKTKYQEIPSDRPYLYTDEYDTEDDSVKPKLNINLPRVEIDPSISTVSDGENKSLNTSSEHNINRSMHQDRVRRYPDRTRSNIDNQYSSDMNDAASDEETLRKMLEKQKDRRLRRRSPDKKDKYPAYEDYSYVAENYPQPQRALTVGRQSKHDLSRVEADMKLLNNRQQPQFGTEEANKNLRHRSFGRDYIVNAVQPQVPADAYNTMITLHKSKSDDKSSKSATKDHTGSNLSLRRSITSSKKSFVERSIMAKTEDIEDYEQKIVNLTSTLENIEQDHKKKIDAIKVQYDSNIKNILKDHNLGVESIQSLHEETLHDLKKTHENEVESLRSMSIEAARKAERLERENRLLKSKLPDSTIENDEEPTTKRRKPKRSESRLTKTNIEAFNLKPKPRSHGPCTCSIDVNISDAIRNIFDQVDTDQRRKAESAYLKYIANKMVTGLDSLDNEELSFLHLKVCRTWKVKLSKEEALQKRINSLEHEVMNKQRNAQQHIAELDRKVAEERRRLQEVREAVCRSPSICPLPEVEKSSPEPLADKDCGCNCNNGDCLVLLKERKSTGDLVASTHCPGTRNKKIKTDINRAVLARLDFDERRERRMYSDEPPTRLRRAPDRLASRAKK